MKKNLLLAIMALTLPLVISGCNNMEGYKLATYTMKDNDYLTIKYHSGYIDMYTTKECHIETLSAKMGYLIKGQFTVQLTYYEMGIDVKVTNMGGYKDITFSYKGTVDYQLISYGSPVSVQ